MLRALLLRLADDDHVLVLITHHVASDGWSMGVLVDEVVALYRSAADGRPSPLAPLPVQYADHAVWQRAWLQGAELERQLAYWREQLDGAAALELPADRVRPARPSLRGGRHSVAPAGRSSAPPSTSSALREEVTPFMVHLAAFAALLHRYSGQDDLSIGVPVAGRTRPEIEPLIGFFVNTLVLRADLSGDPTFRELLARIRRAALGALEHQELPFELLVEELAPRRDLARQPLFQVAFAMQNAPIPEVELPGVTLAPLAVEPGTARFDLTLNILPRPDGPVAAFEYSSRPVRRRSHRAHGRAPAHAARGHGARPGAARVAAGAATRPASGVR